VVNDCSMQMACTSFILKKLNCKVEEAKNGFQALEIIASQKYDGAELKNLFQFVIMDLNMPILNGFDSCRGIDEFFKSEKSVTILDGPDSAGIELNIGYLKPVIAACTGDMLSDELLKKIADFKFDLALETPLTAEKVKDLVLPKV